LALGFLWYLERNLSMKFVHQAQKRLAKVKPTVVAITGSYGKTSTKGYVAHIVGGAIEHHGLPGKLQQPDGPLAHHQ
jgi:UDP-N-acetylmuramoyl-tripeptide--D-alanyl-D-alanine ligase